MLALSLKEWTCFLGLLYLCLLLATDGLTKPSLRELWARRRENRRHRQRAD